MPVPKVKVADDYNPAAGKYRQYVDKAVTEWTIAYPALLELLGDAAGRSVLDFGCGTGQISELLKLQGATIAGVDTSSGMIAAARERLGDSVDLEVVERGHLPASWTNRFDAAIACFVLCVMSSEAIVDCLTSIFRCMKPGGTLIAMNTNWEKCNGHEFASFKLDRIDPLTPGCIVTLQIKGDTPVQIQDYFWTQANYCEMFERAGFSDVAIKEAFAVGHDDRWIDETKAPPVFLISGRKSA